MADFNLYFPILLKLEGGLSNDPLDKGGLTKYGVTLAEWINNGYDKTGDGKIDAADLKIISTQDAANIAKPLYWDRMLGDKINSQSVAEFVCDWGYNSGIVTAIKKLQIALNMPVDGIMGNITLKSVNSKDSQVLFNYLKSAREQFYRNIVKANPSQIKFLNGWLNRNNSFKYHG